MSYSIEVAGPEALADAVGIDDDASRLFAGAEIVFDMGPEHPFVLAERARWGRSAVRGSLWFVRDDDGERVGFAALDELDGAPYLDQLAVRCSAMRRGVGRLLLREALGWAARKERAELWLTTYAHLSWNRAYYEAHGFTVVPEPECGAELVRHLDEQRRWLPFPEQRVAMRHTLTR